MYRINWLQNKACFFFWSRDIPRHGFTYIWRNGSAYNKIRRLIFNQQLIPVKRVERTEYVSETQLSSVLIILCFRRCRSQLDFPRSLLTVLFNKGHTMNRRR